MGHAEQNIVRWRGKQGCTCCGARHEPMANTLGMEIKVLRAAGKMSAPGTPCNPLPRCLHWHGDNAAAVAIAHSGRNPSMRHMGRTHGVNLTFLYDCIESGQVKHGYIETHNMCADLFTKFFGDRKAA